MSICSSGNQAHVTHAADLALEDSVERLVQSGCFQLREYLTAHYHQAIGSGGVLNECWLLEPWSSWGTRRAGIGR